MPSKSDLRVCVNVDNQISRLFSLTERSNGDLVINILAAEHYREIGQLHSDSAPKIVHQKYSIHRSLKSSQKINAIVHRITCDDGSKKTTLNYTKAIKQYNNYAAIYAARSPDLSLERYAVKPDDRDYVLLTPFKSKKATLHYIVCVCGHSAKTITSGKDFRVKYIKFKNFKIAILWSYSYFPSHSSGMKHHFMTVDTNAIPIDQQHLFDKINIGYSAKEIIELHKDTRRDQLKELVNIVSDLTTNSFQELLHYASTTQFTKHPDRKYRPNNLRQKTAKY